MEAVVVGGRETALGGLDGQAVARVVGEQPLAQVRIGDRDEVAARVVAEARDAPRRVGDAGEQAAGVGQRGDQADRVGDGGEQPAGVVTIDRGVAVAVDARGYAPGRVVFAKASRIF